jgi:hypothetical protein
LQRLIRDEEGLVVDAADEDEIALWQAIRGANQESLR